jgi:hypothetical protein
MSKSRGLADLGNVYNDGALSNRNILINGNLTVNQRGVSIASASTGAYGEDRWKKTAGGMTQIIEEVNYLPSTVYTLSGTNVTTQQITSPASGNWTLPDIPVTARLVQLEIGDTATPFEHRSYGQELALCQRFYETSGVGAGGNYEHHRIQATSTMAFTCPPVRYKATKRATPTVTIYGANEVSGKISVLGTNYDYTAVFQSGTDQFTLYHVIPTGWFNYAIEYNWVADAEL